MAFPDCCGFCCSKSPLSHSDIVPGKRGHLCLQQTHCSNNSNKKEHFSKQWYVEGWTSSQFKRQKKQTNHASLIQRCWTLRGGGTSTQPLEMTDKSQTLQLKIQFAMSSAVDWEKKKDWIETPFFWCQNTPVPCHYLTQETLHHSGQHQYVSKQTDSITETWQHVCKSTEYSIRALHLNLH